MATAFGLVLVARPEAGAISLAVIYGIFSLVSGIIQIVHGARACPAPTTKAKRLAPA